MDNLRNFVVAQRRAKNLQIPGRTRSNSLPGSHLLPSDHKAACQFLHPLLEELECSICKEEYSEKSSHQPRTLTCGHTFCKSCIESLLSISKKASEGKNRKRCPVCRISIATSNIADIPVSFTILNILLELRQRRTNSVQQCSMQAVGFCQNHNSPKQFWCISCSVWLCGACALLKHKEDNNGKCEIKTVDETVIAKKVEHGKQLAKVEESYATITKSISDAIDVCHTTKKLIRSDVTILEQKLKEAKLRYKSFDSMQDKIREMSSEVDEEWSKHVEVSEEVKQAKEYPQLDAAMVKFQTLQSRFLKRDFLMKFPYNIWSKRLLIECLLAHPNIQQVYAIDYDDILRRWLKVSLRWPDLCLHSVGGERPSLGSIQFQADDVTEGAHTFFLDLCYASDVDIRLKVQITESSEFLPIFVSLCLGRNERPFKGSKFVALEIDEDSSSKVMWMGHVEPRRTSLVSSGTGDKNEPNTQTTKSNRRHSFAGNGASPEKDAASVARLLNEASAQSDRTWTTNDTSSSLDVALQLPHFSKPQNCLRRVQSKVMHPAGSIFVKVIESNGEEVSQQVHFQFGILLNEAVVSNNNYIDVGSVVSGDLKFLTEYLQMDNIKQLIIKDCGYQIEANAEHGYKT